MKNILFFSVALVAAGLNGAENAPKTSPIKVFVKKDVPVDTVELSPELCHNSSFRSDTKTPVKSGTSSIESTIQELYERGQKNEFDDLGGWKKTCEAIAAANIAKK